MSYARGRAVAGEDSEEEEEEQQQPQQPTIASVPRGQLVSGEDSEEEEEEQEQQATEQPAVPAAKPAPIAVSEPVPAPATSAAEQPLGEAAVAEPSADPTTAASSSVASVAAPAAAAAQSAAASPSASAPSAAPSSSSAPAAPRPVARKPVVLSARVQRLKGQSESLSGACAKSVHTALHRTEQNLSATAALFTQTLSIVQDNSSNIKIANGHFESCLPLLDALINSHTFGQIKAE